MFQRILITGSTGFLGRHIVPALRAAFGGAELVAVGRRDADLLQPGAPARLLADVKPDVVVHLAAKSGGIQDNRKRPAACPCDSRDAASLAAKGLDAEPMPRIEWRTQSI